MALAFPSSPTDGQWFPPYFYRAAEGAWHRYSGRALPKNLIVNPAMQVSQQNGVTAQTNPGNWPADQWQVYYMPAPIVVTFNQFATAGVYKLKAVVTTGKAVLAANDHAVFYQRIEGNRIADLAWGTAAARDAVLRFGWKSPVGTYTVTISNAADTRHFIQPFVVTQANTDLVFTFPIPGSTVGAWPADNTQGLTVYFTLAAGPDLLGPAGWNTAGGSLRGVTGMTNGVATAAAEFYLSNVGLYEDPYKTGIAPEFEIPEYTDDILECMRYWYPLYRSDGVATAATGGYTWANNPITMRATPAISLVGNTLKSFDGNAAYDTITNVVAYNCTPQATSMNVQTASGVDANRPYKTMADGQLAGYIAVSARM